MSREEKVEKLKEKIRNEIKICRKDIGYVDPSNKDLLLTALVFLAVEEYINNSNTFMTKSADGNYIVSDKHLDIMLDSKFSFIHTLIVDLKCNGSSEHDIRYNIINLLSDEYFEYHFISIIGEIIYDKTGHWGV